MLSLPKPRPRSSMVTKHESRTHFTHWITVLRSCVPQPRQALIYLYSAFLGLAEYRKDSGPSESGERRRCTVGEEVWVLTPRVEHGVALQNTAYTAHNHLLPELTGGRKTQTNAAVSWSI